jgi:hypothetical protein
VTSAAGFEKMRKVNTKNQGLPLICEEDRMKIRKKNKHLNQGALICEEVDPRLEEKQRIRRQFKTNMCGFFMEGVCKNSSKQVSDYFIIIISESES